MPTDPAVQKDNANVVVAKTSTSGNLMYLDDVKTRVSSSLVFSSSKKDNIA